MTRRVHHQTSSRLLRNASAAVLAAALLGGCSEMSPQTTQLQYAASDGVMGEAGPLVVRNLLLVTNSTAEVATVAGTLVNNGDQPLQIHLGSASGGELAEPIEVPAGGRVTLTEGDPIEVPIQSGPGTLVPFVLRDAQQSEVKLSLEVPVLDATLPEYATLAPGGGGDEPTTTRPPEGAASPTSNGH